MGPICHVSAFSSSGGRTYPTPEERKRIAIRGDLKDDQGGIYALPLQLKRFFSGDASGACTSRLVSHCLTSKGRRLVFSTRYTCRECLSPKFLLMLKANIRIIEGRRQVGLLNHLQYEMSGCAAVFRPS